MADLAYNQLKLSDGRIIEMREQVGNDEMIVAAQLGKVFTPDGGGAVVFQSCLIARTIVSIDEKKCEPLRGYESYRDFLGQFSGKDLTRIKKLYEKLNDDIDTEGNV